MRNPSLHRTRRARPSGGNRGPAKAGSGGIPSGAEHGSPIRTCFGRDERGGRKRWPARTTRRRVANPQSQPAPGGHSQEGKRLAEAQSAHDPHGEPGNRYFAVAGGTLPVTEPGSRIRALEWVDPEESRREQNGRKAQTAVMRNGCRRGGSFEGKEHRGEDGSHLGPSGSRSPRWKRDEPRAGSGVQQTRDVRAEEVVKAVRNREGGTGPDAWQHLAEGRAETSDREWTLERTPAGRRKRTWHERRTLEVQRGAKALVKKQA